MTVTHYHKDASRIYWRVECTAADNGGVPEWDVEVFRSLEDFRDPDAHEVFHTSIPRIGGTVDTAKIVAEMGRYYMGVLLGMAEHLQSTYAPETH